MRRTRVSWYVGVLGLVLLSACGSATVAGGGGSQPTVDALLAVDRWEVVQLPGVSALPETNGPTLAFTADGRASGTTGCNQYGGGFERTDTSFTFTQMVSTRMACQEGNRMEVEAAWLRALEATRSLTLADQVLSLFAEDGALLARLVPG